jgi:hypothetical protein
MGKGKWRRENGEGVRKELKNEGIKELKNEGIKEWRNKHILCKVNTL